MSGYKYNTMYIYIKMNMYVNDVAFYVSIL